MTSRRQRRIRQALEEILTCPICLDRLQGPRLLECQHSACFRCLVQWYQASLSCTSEAIACPLCRKLTRLPQEGFLEELPGDVNKNILLDILDSAADGAGFGPSRSHCTVCDLTGRVGAGGAKTPASAFCADCKDHLCSPCLEEHNALPLLQRHRVAITPHGSRLAALVCREHRNKSLDFYCHRCVRLVCSICLRTTHRDHLAEAADDVSRSRKRDIAAHKRAVNTRLLALQSSSRAFNIDRRASAKHRIATFSSIRRSSFDMASAIAMLDSLVHFCDYLLNQADPGEVVAAADHVRRRAETLLTETEPDEFTEGIIALLCQGRPEHLARRTGDCRQTGTGNRRRGFGGSLTSDDRSSDVTDDASFVGSDPGGAVTDLDDCPEDAEEDSQNRTLEAQEDEEEGQEAGREESGDQADNGEDHIFRSATGTGPPTDVTCGSPSLLWRCTSNGPDVGQVDGPWDVTFTENGDVIVTEAVNNRVQLFTEGGGSSRVLFEGFEPRGVTTAPDGSIAVVDHSRHCVRLLPLGSQTVAESVIWTPENVAEPEVVAFAPNGYRVVTDAGKHVVAVYNEDGHFLRSFGERGSSAGQFRQPLYVSVSRRGKIVVGDLHNNRIQAFTLDGKFLGRAGQRGAGDGQLRYPRGVAWDGSDHILVADGNNARISVFDHDGRWMSHLLTDQQGLKKTRGVAVAPSGETLVAVTDRDNEFSSLTVWQVKE